jgi:hypothetical protein
MEHLQAQDGDILTRTKIEHISGDVFAVRKFANAEVVADPPAPPCYFPFFGARIEDYQWVDPDLFSPRVHARGFLALRLVMALVFRPVRGFTQVLPLIVFPAKAGIHVSHGHRPSPV